MPDRIDSAAGNTATIVNAAFMGAVFGASAVVFLNKDLRSKFRDLFMDTLDKGSAKLDEATESLQKAKLSAIRKTSDKLNETRQKMEENK